MKKTFFLLFALVAGLSLFAFSKADFNSENTVAKSEVKVKVLISKGNVEIYSALLSVEEAKKFEFTRDLSKGESCTYVHGFTGCSCTAATCAIARECFFSSCVD
jgi:hypothetical protein